MRLKPKSEFSRNVLTLMTGTTVAQIIPIAISPILTRIYTPEDFGIFAIFMAIVFIFGSISTGRYEFAIMLPKKDEDAINVFALGFIINVFISVVLLLIVILLHSYIVETLDNQEIGPWLYLTPITVFFIGFFNLLNYFNTRKKNYKDIANATVIKSIVLAITQLSIGFIKQGALGLISGQILSQLFANMRLFKNIVRDKVLMSKVSKVKMIALARRYRDFPKYSMPAIFANTMSLQLMNILISTFYNTATLGFYSFVQKMLSMPFVLIGNSIGQVFFEEAMKEKQETKKADKSFRHTFKKLVFLGFPLFFVLFFIVEELFAFVFGEAWRIAGEYAQIVLPLFFIRFVVVSISNLSSVFELHKMFFMWQVMLLFLSIGLFYVSSFYQFDFNTFLQLYTVVISTHYLILLYILRKVAIKGEL